MPTPPDEKGIVNAMKSMKSIATSGTNRNNGAGFPKPPINFAGSGASTKPKAKTATSAPSNNNNNKKKKQQQQAQPPNPKQPGGQLLEPSEKSSNLPLPPVARDTNSQLFGTLVNSLKTAPVEAGRANKARSSKNTGKRYASSVSSSSSITSCPSSLSTSSSLTTASSLSSSSSSFPNKQQQQHKKKKKVLKPSAKTAKTSPSSYSSTSSLSSALSSSSIATTKSDKVAREKKKRRDELLQEKVELLTRIVNLSKNGFASTKKWEMKDDLDEIRYECYRMQRESNSKKSIKIMRRVLVTITTLIETGNSFFNPFNLRLDGFSESMMLNLNDYDDCFEQIHHKYSGRSSVGPEMQILFTFLSAAIFHHAGNAIGQNKGAASQQKASTATPMSSIMNMMGMFSNSTARTTPLSTASASAAAPSTTAHTHAHAPSSNDKPKRKTMRGPGAPSIPHSIISGASQVTTPSMTLNNP